MHSSEHTQSACIEIAARQWRVDLARPQTLAIPLRLGAEQPGWFAAPRARALPLHSGDFSGSVLTGASCNCATIELTPHCNGTHTECAGHLTREALDVCEIVPRAMQPAWLLSVTPEAPGNDEPCHPAARLTDKLITRAALEKQWPAQPQPAPSALVIRTRPNSQEKCRRNYDQQPAAYLTPAAAHLLVERGIEHLVLDVPSADRADDDGHMSAHRIFFGLPTRSHALAEASRAHCTITELAFIPDEIGDGRWLLALQVPRISGDALPSQPLLYSVREA